MVGNGVIEAAVLTFELIPFIACSNGLNATNTAVTLSKVRLPIANFNISSTAYPQA